MPSSNSQGKGCRLMVNWALLLEAFEGVNALFTVSTTQT